jgi:hypothetical protein
MALEALFKLQLHIKGSIVECGVHNGASLMTWAKLSATLEPYNYHRKVIGFDTFEGFPEDSIGDMDGPLGDEVRPGDFPCNMVRLNESIGAFDADRPISHKPKVELVKGDACETIPRWLGENRHALISLLFLDFDLYGPTVDALKHFADRVPPGAVLAFDQLNNPDWPGETMAFVESSFYLSQPVRSFPWEPNISYMVIR